jgi:hypothetical protein
VRSSNPGANSSTGPTTTTTTTTACVHVFVYCAVYYDELEMSALYNIPGNKTLEQMRSRGTTKRRTCGGPGKNNDETHVRWRRDTNCETCQNNDIKNHANNIKKTRQNVDSTNTSACTNAGNANTIAATNLCGIFREPSVSTRSAD